MIISKTHGTITRAAHWSAALVVASVLALTMAFAASAPRAYAQDNRDALQATTLGASDATLSASGTTLTASDATEAPNVAKRSKANIVARLKSNAASLSNPVTYATEPVLNTTAGALSQETKESALKMLNNIRYIAGLNDVSLNDAYGELAQAGAFVNSALERLTHTPIRDGLAKPAGMSDSLWSLGDQGAGSSNLAMGYGTLNAAVLGWMSDEDAYNIDRVGHRRWCINPAMGSTGFGASGRYYAMYSFDARASSTASNVAWPAQVMPVELFSDDLPWSLSVGQAISNSSAVKVTLTRTTDGKVWTFDTLSQSTPERTTDAYFNVENSYYGQPGCIIFRPGNISYQVGDKFHVSITGVNGKNIAYDVEFITGYPVESISFAQDPFILKYNGGSIAPVVEPSNARGYEVAWESSDPSIVQVSADGTLTKGKPGTATITATVSGAYTANGQPISKSVQVVVPSRIDTSTCDISFSNLQYTGSIVQPKATIVDKATKKTLVEGIDYELELNDPIVNAGDTTIVWVKGKGVYDASEYSGYYVTVEPRTITAGMASISAKSFVYNGKPRTQTVSVTFNGKALKQGTNYKVTYKNNTSAGKATVTVTGMGNFAGTVSKSFNITMAANPLQVKGLTAKAKYNKKKAATVKATAAFKFTKKGMGKIVYARVASGSSKYLSINKSTGNITVKKGAPKKTHVLKVKVTAKGDANYKSATKTVTVKVRVK